MTSNDTENIPEIMCTLTVRQIESEEALVLAMYDAGMRSVRINTAHLCGVEQLDALALRLKALVPDVRILIDTKGPEMRTTATVDDVTLTFFPGQSVVLMGDDADTDTTEDIININYPEIHTEVRAGDKVLIDDGHLVLIVDRVEGKKIFATVHDGGQLGSRKGVSVAGVDVNLPSVSQRDEMYIRYAAGSELIDEVAHSFVRSAADVEAVKRVMVSGNKPVIAKIENQQGIDNLDQIIAVADGVLIARGDLTACIGAEAVPQAQAVIARAAKAAGKPLYLATNILPSMMSGVNVSERDFEGIKLAQSQSVDVMLLTNETASGAYPLQSVATLRSILTLD